MFLLLLIVFIIISPWPGQISLRGGLAAGLVLLSFLLAGSGFEVKSRRVVILDGNHCMEQRDFFDSLLHFSRAYNLSGPQLLCKKNGLEEGIFQLVSDAGGARGEEGAVAGNEGFDNIFLHPSGNWYVVQLPKLPEWNTKGDERLGLPLQFNIQKFPLVLGAQYLSLFAGGYTAGSATKDTCILLERAAKVSGRWKSGTPRAYSAYFAAVCNYHLEGDGFTEEVRELFMTALSNIGRQAQHQELRGRILFDYALLLAKSANKPKHLEAAPIFFEKSLLLLNGSEIEPIARKIAAKFTR